MSIGIELVSHCFDAPEKTGDQYCRLQCLQIASLLRHPPKCGVKLTIIYESSDIRTFESLLLFAGHHHDGRVQIAMMGLQGGRMFRRAIGRNMVFQNLLPTTQAVWCADSDGYFGAGCLDAVYEAAVSKKFYLGTPARYMIHQTHELGDRCIAAVPSPPVLGRIDPSEFSEIRGRPIGGAVIVRADIARKYGYCPDNPRAQSPMDDNEGFTHFSCDIKFRKQMKSLGYNFQPLDVPNFFRIRHSIGPDGQPHKYITQADGRRVSAGGCDA